MSENTEKDSINANREELEQLLNTHAPYIHIEDFQLRGDEEYGEVLRSIQDHKYLTNERIPFEISMEQALFSWYENVYHPMMLVIDEEGLPWAFPGLTQGELFLRLSRHWHFLKREQGREVGVDEALYSFGTQFGTGLLNRFWYRVKLRAA